MVYKGSGLYPIIYALHLFLPITNLEWACLRYALWQFALILLKVAGASNSTTFIESYKPTFSRGCHMYYHLSGNFRRVLIFIIFMIDLAVMKLYPQKLMPTVDMFPIIIYDGLDQEHSWC